MHTRKQSTLGVSASLATLVMLISSAAPGLASQSGQHAQPKTPQLAVGAVSGGSNRAVPRGGGQPADTCYSQRDNDNGVGIVSQSFEPDNSSYDSRAADDFTLDADCTVGEVQVDGAYFNGAGPAPTVNVTFYQDESGAPGDVVSNQTNLGYTDSTGSGTLDITINPTLLAAGTYWMSVQINMAYSAGGEWGWSTNNAQRGNPALWQNPGDGFGTGCTSYQSMTTCIPSGEGPDLSFALTPASDDGSNSQQLGGYVVDLGAGAKGGVLKNTGSTATPSDPCGDLADGTKVSFTNSLEMQDQHGIDHNVSVIRLGVCSANRVDWTYWWSTSDGAGALQYGAFHLSVLAKDTVRTQFSIKGTQVVATVKDLTSGATEKHLTKLIDKASPILFNVGVSGTGPNGKDYEVGGFKSQRFSKVLVEGKSIDGLDPKSVTLVDPDGNPLYRPAPIRFGFVMNPIVFVSDSSSWNGWDQILGWGCPTQSTFGEVITIPNNVTHLDNFSFRWMPMSYGSLVARGEVYKWDGTKATGSALYESAPFTYNTTSFGFQPIGFSTAGVSVTPGTQYVIFASIDKDFEQCLNNDQVYWGAVPDSAYTGGTFVLQDNYGDESKWTTSPWYTATDIDTVFTLTMH